MSVVLSESVTADNKTGRTPNLIIPGVQKAGTSALHAYLSGHPDCLMSDPKEPNYFGAGFDIDRLTSYRRCFARRHASPGPRIVGEASTTYLNQPEVPRQIATVLGRDVRIVVLLRNPVDRALSAYWHMAKRFAECRSLQQVFGALPARLDDAIGHELEAIDQAVHANSICERRSGSAEGGLWNFRYIDNSRYLQALQTFESVFGRARLHVILSEELRSQPQIVLSHLARFLDIPNLFSIRRISQLINVTRVPRTDPVSCLIARVVRSLPGGPLQPLRRTLQSLTTFRPAPPLPQVHQRLCSLFTEHNRELAEYLDRDLTVWKVPR